MVDEPELVVENVGRVRVLRLNRPYRRNALSVFLSQAIVDAAGTTADDRQVWAVVLTGTGPDAFCSGMDLKEAHARNVGTSEGRPPPARVALGPFEALLALPMPTIAAINGSAVAGGLELALACDLRVCSSRARLGVPEVTRGLVGNFAATILPRLVPAALAHEMLFTGQTIDAAEAHRWGLVNRVTEPDQVLPVAMALAASICENAPIAVRHTKARSRAGAVLPIEAAYRLDLGPDPRDSADRAEGIAAFVEKRPPRWQNA
jgi:enoyl-CoA hydratase